MQELVRSNRRTGVKGAYVYRVDRPDNENGKSYDCDSWTVVTQSGHVNSKNYTFYASVIVDVFKVNCYILCFAHMLHLRHIIILLLSRTKFASLWRGHW